MTGNTRYLIAVRHERYFNTHNGDVAPLTALGARRAHALVTRRLPSLVSGRVLVAHSGFRRTAQMADMMPGYPVVKAEWTYVETEDVAPLLRLPWEQYDTIVGFTHEPIIRALLALAGEESRRVEVGYGQPFRFELNLETELFKLAV